MLKLGIPPEDIPKFSDGKYWLEYFPPRNRQDLQDFGICVDWRRSFITTDVSETNVRKINSMIDSFVGISILSKQEISLLLERETPSIQSLISSLVLTTIAQSEKKCALKTTLSLKSRSSNLCQSPLNNLKASILFIYRLLLSVLKPCMARPIVSFFLKANTESTK